MQDIRKLFPSDYNPFYAGFGNRDTDELSYKKMGIPKGKIFIINPKVFIPNLCFSLFSFSSILVHLTVCINWQGEVATSHRIDVKSYTSLHTLVNDMFPPTSLVEHEQVNLRLKRGKGHVIPIFFMNIFMTTLIINNCAGRL